MIKFRISFLSPTDEQFEVQRILIVSTNWTERVCENERANV